MYSVCVLFDLICLHYSWFVNPGSVIAQYIFSLNFLLPIGNSIRDDGITLVPILDVEFHKFAFYKDP